MLHRQLRELEAEVRDCEARVRLHDTRLRHSVLSLKRDLVYGGAGKLLMAGGALAGGAIAWWWTARPRRHARARHGRRRARAYARPRERSSWPSRIERWGPLLLPLLTPLLDRKVALTFARLGLPVAVQPLRDLPTADHVDFARFAGAWHQLAELRAGPQREGLSEVRFDYEVDAEQGLRVTRRFVGADGRLAEQQGRLRVPDAAHHGQVEITFAPPFLQWWPGVWHDHWVIFVDDGYRAALVGSPERDHLLILARDPQLDAADLEALKSLALRHGFDTTRLQATPAREPGPEAPA
jgi:apolipoprotein D and lipocalin family protein